MVVRREKHSNVTLQVKEKPRRMLLFKYLGTTLNIKYDHNEVIHVRGQDKKKACMKNCACIWHLKTSPFNLKIEIVEGVQCLAGVVERS